MTNERPVIALVGCGSAKHPGRLPAGAKYSSNYFGLKRDYAETIADYWAIVSAKHGLVEPHEWIGDYDKSVRDMSADERQQWGYAAGGGILQYLAHIDEYDSYPSEVHLLLGQAYLDPIEERLDVFRDHSKLDLIYPFESTSGIGEQMNELKTQIEEATE